MQCPCKCCSYGKVYCPSFRILLHAIAPCGLSEVLDILCLKYTKSDVTTLRLNQHEIAVHSSMYVTCHCGAPSFSLLHE
jgi:hypothetical protein